MSDFIRVGDRFIATGSTRINAGETYIVSMDYGKGTAVVEKAANTMRCSCGAEISSNDMFERHENAGHVVEGE